MRPTGSGASPVSTRSPEHPFRERRAKAARSKEGSGRALLPYCMCWSQQMPRRARHFRVYRCTAVDHDVGYNHTVTVVRRCAVYLTDVPRHVGHGVC